MTSISTTDPIDVFGWTVRTSNCLKNSNIRTVGDLLSSTEELLVNSRNFGKKSLMEVSNTLEAFGFKLGMFNQVKIKASPETLELKTQSLPDLSNLKIVKIQAWLKNQKKKDKIQKAVEESEQEICDQCLKIFQIAQSLDEAVDAIEILYAQIRAKYNKICLIKSRTTRERDSLRRVAKSAATQEDETQ